MKTAKAAALLAVILLLSISFGACSANNAAAETEASQQTPEATSTPDVTVELDTSEDKGAGKSNAGSMSVDEQRYASVLDLYYQALYAHQAGTADWDRDKYVVERGLAECIVNPYWAWENSDGLLSRIGYSFRDLNGDGTNELLLGWIGGDFCPMEDGYAFAVYTVYTIKNGQPLLAFQGQERDRFLIGDDGYVYRSGSSGAAYSEYEKYRFHPEWQYCLEPVELFYSQIDEDNHFWWEHVVGAEQIMGLQRLERHEEYVMDSDFAMETGKIWTSSGVNLRPSNFLVYAAKRG